MRYTAYLRSRYAAVLNIVGQSLVVVGLVIAAPMLLAMLHPDEVYTMPVFLLTGGAVSLVGWLLTRFPMEEADALSFLEGTVVVVLIWICTMVASVVPFMTLIDLTFSQALFESVSGWTTTGLTVVDVTTAPRTVLLFRSLMQFAGGAGVAIIVLSSLAGPSGIGFTAAEGTSTQVVPNVISSAKIVLRLYCAYAVIGIIALALAGMPLFDSIVHALAAVSTGGFSSQTASIGFYDSAIIEAIIIVLMILGALNFVTAYTLFQGEFETVARNSELRFFMLLILIVIGLLLAGVTLPAALGTGEAVRIAAFEGVSMLTGTGFTVTTYTAWPAFGLLLVIISMTIGGSTESTAGGLKQLRVLVLLRTMFWEIRRAFLSEHTVNQPSYTTINDEKFITDHEVRQAALFAVSYVAVLAVGTLAFTVYGYSLTDSLFEFASALGTAGLSVGVTSPDMPPTLLWVAIVGMFLGRLEILAIIIGLGKIVIDAPVLAFGGGEKQ